MSSVGAYSPRLDLEPVDESWPVRGVPSSQYSRHKAAAEKIVAQFAREHRDRAVTVLRPGIVGQRTVGSALLRHGLPGLLPARAVNVVRLVPLPRGFTFPVVHSDDVAAAIELALQARVAGAYNLAAHDPVTPADIGAALQARTVPVPASVLRAAVAASWSAGLQPVDPGWFDLAMNVPLLDSRHAASELGWKPTVAAAHVLYETVNGMRRAVDGPTPPLRTRSVPRALRDAVAHGPVSHRRLP
jgi:nucleoside-diphosphate-sugar epimerase